MMAFGFLLSPPPLPLPSPTAAATAASYLVSAVYGRRHRPLERSCRCGRPPETALSGRGSYDGEEASPRPLGVGGSSASSSKRQMGEARRLSYLSCRAIRACGSLEAACNVWMQSRPILSCPFIFIMLSNVVYIGSAAARHHETLQEGGTSTDADGFSKCKSKSGYFKEFGVDLSPDNVAVAIVYFVQGVLGLSRLAVSFYLKDDLHLDPAETAVISGFSALPWLVKPLYGFISDSIPLFGYRRRSYLFLSGLLGALSWSLMATIVDDKYSAALAIILGSLAVAVSDVKCWNFWFVFIIHLKNIQVVDSMVVERARGESQSTSGSLQSLCWGSSAFGGVVSAYFSGSFVDIYGVRFVFGVTALLPLLTSTVAVLVNEEPLPLGERSVSLSVSGSELIESSKQRFMQIWNSVKQPSICLPTLFIFLWQATPQSDSAMFFFMYVPHTHLSA
nr:unnamed protein product [Digitaria exilis]CAB3497883.1 unnamed protein product [Digitaria exilis]